MWYLYGVFILLLVLFTFVGIKVGGDGPPERRMKAESSILKKNNYEIVNEYDSDTRSMVVKKIKDDGGDGKDDEDQGPEQYTITVPEDYPFAGNLTINDIDFIVECGTETITDYIEKYKIPRVLIYCHPKNVDIYAPEVIAEDNPNKPQSYHWQNNIIYNQIRNAGVSDPTKTAVWCVDPAERIPQLDYSRVNQADGFSDDFVNARQSWYTTIAIPDCGGEWYVHGSVDKWVKLIIKASGMLAPGGTLVAGKFFSKKNTVNPKDGSAAVVGKLKENHSEKFDIEAIQIGSEWYVTLKKK